MRSSTQSRKTNYIIKKIMLSHGFSFLWKERRPDSICFPALTVFSLGEMWGMSSPPHCEHKSFYQEWRWCCLLDRYYTMFSCSQRCSLCDVQHVHWVTAAWRPRTDVYSHRLVVIAFLRVCLCVQQVRHGKRLSGMPHRVCPPPTRVCFVVCAHLNSRHRLPLFFSSRC